MKKWILKRFNVFPLGVRRLLIAGVLVFPLILSRLFFLIADEPYHGEGGFIFAIIFGIPAYIILVLISAWVYAGFKSEK